MTINLHTLRALQSPAGADLLAQLASVDLAEANTLRLLTELRKDHPTDIAAAALETARLRIKAQDKFGARSANMFFTREALEQATDSRISRYRFANRDLLSPGAVAVDLGCSIGGDTLIMAETMNVIGVDRDPLRLALARANVLSERAVFIQADLTDPLPLGKTLDFAFFDPARRTEDGYRRYSVKDYIPPLDVIERWTITALMVKLSPGVDLAEVQGYDGVVEFISLMGALKEAVLHLNSSFVKARTATLIDAAGNVAQMVRGHAEREPQIEVSEPHGVLYEPDPAVIRAGLVQDLGAQISAHLIDPTIAYLTGEQAVQTPFARHWPIEDWMPFNLKHLRAYLRERDVGRVTVKKRGSPITPEELIAKLKLPSSAKVERIVVLTRVKGAPATIICRSE